VVEGQSDLAERLGGFPWRRAGLRFGASATAALVYALFAGLWFWARRCYHALLGGWDAMPNARPFGDLGSILQAMRCWRDGVNVYAPSVCMHGGLYNYSPFLLRAVYLGLGPQDLMAGGLLYGVVLILAFSALPLAKSWAEMWVRTFGICSATVVFGLESANIDILLFVLTVAGVWMLLAGRWMALLGYALFMLLAACKFYPVALLGLAVRERPVVLLGVVALTVMAAVVFFLHFAHGTAAAMGILPGGLPFVCVFGAMNIPFGLMLLRFLPVLTLAPSVPQFFAAVSHPQAALWVGMGTRLVSVAGLAAGYLIAPRYRVVMRAMEHPRQLFFMAGAILTVFCFFAAQNLSYRAVFLLLLLPGAWDIAVARYGRWWLAGILLLLWEPLFREHVTVWSKMLLGPVWGVIPQIVYWFLREGLWWWIVIQLLALIICFWREAAARFMMRIAPLDSVRSVSK
jgi:hypothetical protein